MKNIFQLPMLERTVTYDTLIIVIIIPILLSLCKAAYKFYRNKKIIRVKILRAEQHPNYLAPLYGQPHFIAKITIELEIISDRCRFSSVDIFNGDKRVGVAYIGPYGGKLGNNPNHQNHNYYKFGEFFKFDIDFVKTDKIDTNFLKDKLNMRIYEDPSRQKLLKKIYFKLK